MSRVRPLPTIAAFLIFVVILVDPGCRKQDVPFVVDNDVIIQYLERSPDAASLFRRDNLILPTEYTLPSDTGAVYKVLIDSTRRRYDLSIFIDTVRVDTVPYQNPSIQYYRLHHIYPSPLFDKWDGEVVIDDFYYVRELRIAGADTTVTPSTRAVTRYGYFLKLGNDTQPYRGWKLWAFNGDTASGAMTVQADNDTTFTGDQSGLQAFTYTVVRDNLTTGVVDTSYGSSQQVYRRVDRQATIKPGVPLYMNCSNVDSHSYYRLVTTYTDSGYRQSVMDRASSTSYVDTVKAPTQSPNAWNLIFVQDYKRIQEPGSNPPVYVYSWHGWCVPYRIAP